MSFLGERVWWRALGPRVAQPRKVLTPEGIRTAVFFTKVHDRVLRPLFCAADVSQHDRNFPALSQRSITP
jgi:hypothetical protein